MVLHRRDDDLIARADVLPPERLRDQVDALRRVADENDLVGVRRVQKVLDLDAALLVGARRLSASRCGERWMFAFSSV